MSDTLINENNTLTIYGCGGAGINIAKNFLNVPFQKGSCKVQTILTDTSEANLRALQHDKIFIYEGLDGSGKVRNQNYDAIKERTKKFLYDYKPSKFNLVIHSASGGTGSVIGPMIAAELLKQDDRIVIPVIVGNDNNMIEAENSLKTLKSYENIATRCGKPITIIYDHNKESRAMIDNRLSVMITLLILLLSKDNIEIDSEDIRNFFRYDRVTNHPAGLSVLSAYTADSTPPAGLIATAVRLKEETDHKVYDDLMVEYLTEGYIPKDVVKELEVKLPITYTVILNSIAATVEGLHKTIAKFEELRSTHTYTSIKLDRGSEDDNGMVL